MSICRRCATAVSRARFNWPITVRMAPSATMPGRAEPIWKIAMDPRMPMSITAIIISMRVKPCSDCAARAIFIDDLIWGKSRATFFRCQSER